MRRIFDILLVLSLTAATACGATSSGTQSPFAMGSGAREIALGSANIALCNPGTAPFWNPSRLAQSERLSINGFHTSLYESDVAYDYLGMAIPTLSYGSFGLGVFSLRIGGIEKRDSTNFSLGEFDDSRLALYAAYGRKVRDYDIGAALLFEHHSIDNISSTSSPGLTISATRRFTFATGILSECALALVGSNMIKPGMKLVDETITMPFSARLGLSTVWRPLSNRNHSIGLHGALTKIDRGDPEMAGGIEYGYAGLLHLRGGTNQDGFTLGAGLEYKSLAIDYALVDRDLGYLHMFNISSSFGATISERREEKARKREADFNRLMNERLNGQNASMINELKEQGDEHTSRGDIKEAFACYDKALFMARNTGNDTTSLAIKVASARSKLNELEKMETYANHLDSAQAKLDQQDWLTARYYAELALALVPDSDKAKALREQTIAAMQANSTREELITSKLDAIDSLLNYGHVEVARQSLISLENYAPADKRVAVMAKRVSFEYWRQTASTAYESGRLRDASAALDSALVMFPGHQWCLDLKKQIQAAQKQAVAVVPVTTHLSPAPTLSKNVLKEVDENYRTGQDLFQHGDLSGAIGLWEKVERIAPDYQSVRDYLVKAYRFVGIELYGQNKLTEAVTMWKKAAQLAPDNNEIMVYIQRTESEIRRLKELSYESR